VDDCAALWPGPDTAFGLTPGDWFDIDCAVTTIGAVCEGPNAPAGSTRLAGVPGSRWLVSGLLSWSNAAERCASVGDRLLRPVDAVDNDAVAAALRSIEFGHSVWLSASDRAVEGVWRWQDSERVGATFVAFGVGEPNDQFGREDCLAMNASVWNDARCSLNRPFLCDDLSTVSMDCTPLQGLTAPSRFLCTQGRNHDHARAACVSGGGHLARFDSYTTWSATIDAFAAAAPAIGEVWIDGTDADVEGVWRRSDGVVITDVR
jgi:hypothetical protein